MNLNRRVFISAPRDVRLDAPRLRIKQAIVDEVRAADYLPQMFLTPAGGEGLAAGAGWSVDEVDRVVRRCVGAVLIGLPFWKTTQDGREVWLPSDYCPYEGAIARTLRLPILSISIGIESRGLFHDHAPVCNVTAPFQDDLSWLMTPRFRGPFDRWRRDVDDRRDVFLGYSSKNKDTALQIQAEAEKAGASVLNWESDFIGGGSILEAIEAARSKCSCGIFLFSEDDRLEDAAGGVAPRDNVVFEAGYFMSAQGPGRCLVVRKGEPKMPADVGGTIYLQIRRGADVASIAPGLRNFLTSNLT